VVFADWHNHRIRRIVPGGPITTLAGDGTADLGFSNHLSRRFPATACSIPWPHDLAVAPDGRIVFTLGGPLGIFILHPDGTLGRARPVPGAARITVTEDNAIVAWDGHQRLQRLVGDDPPVALAETRAPLQALAPMPGGGVLILAPYQPMVCALDPPQAGMGLVDLAYNALTAFRKDDLGRVAAIRASLARWAETYPPAAEVVRDHLLATRAATPLPGLPEDLQTVPFEWLRDDYRAAGIRARIALHVLDQALEDRVAGTVDRVKALAAPR
jgi:hypothetical protein